MADITDTATIFMIDTGSSTTDKVTNDNRVFVTGLNYDTSTWQYSYFGGLDWSAPQASTVNHFTVLEGLHKANNLQVKVTSVTNTETISKITEDYTVKTTPDTLRLALNNDTSNGHNVTKDLQVNVFGVSTGSTWEYSLNGSSWTTGTGTSFNLTDNTYFGLGMVKARSIDIAGNYSAIAYLSHPIETDNTADTITIESPYQELSSAISISEAKALQLWGSIDKKEAGQVIIISITDGARIALATATTDAQGDWILTGGQKPNISDFAEGNLTITANGKDLAGNVSNEGTLTVAFDKTTSSVASIFRETYTKAITLNAIANDYIVNFTEANQGICLFQVLQVVLLMVKP